jgi:hypothetical protein
MNLFESSVDFNTNEGAKLKRIVEFRLATLRSKLENATTHDESQKLRGAIGELRALLAPPPQAQTPTHYSGMEFRN